MMKLVWDSIEKDPNRFNHYIILTSKGDEQGTLILLPGNINSRGKFDERNTIAKYFNSYSDFINNIAVINRSYDPENDHIGTEKLTNLAINGIQPGLLVVDNFEDFEDGHSDFEHFQNFFNKFNKIKEPRSRIILTTRGDGKLANNTVNLDPLNESDTADLFAARLTWLKQKNHYKKLVTGDIPNLISNSRSELIALKNEENKDNKKVLERIGHPASILLLAASIEDEVDSNPLEFFKQEIIEMKKGKFGVGKSDFSKYCVDKALDSQKNYPYLKTLVSKLSQKSAFSKEDVNEDMYRIGLDELTFNEIDKIIQAFSSILVYRKNRFKNS